ncbi:hypothetical protein AWZ03_005918 [Drosophila navojoa]|uniref:Uncharacterized protein n=1 Tax=Drosophila navojoa TaxID=7232 RepID=A0A484BHW3_DRONA|nr:hypothetical protein AWZ03_005918 [Drosophila navojoa]
MAQDQSQTQSQSQQESLSWAGLGRSSWQKVAALYQEDSKWAALGQPCNSNSCNCNCKSNFLGLARA